MIALALELATQQTKSTGTLLIGATMALVGTAVCVGSLLYPGGRNLRMCFVGFVIGIIGCVIALG